MKYKAIIFDLFGTIINTFSQAEYEEVLNEMADILNAPAREFSQLWFDSFKERMTGDLDTPRGSIEYICKKLNLKATEEKIEHASRVRLDFSARNMVPRPGAVEVITHLKSCGYKTGLISDCSQEISTA